MDDTFQEDSAAAEGKTSPLETARDLGRLLGEHRGGDVAVLDLRSLKAWTDFFVIATAGSDVHLQGLERHVDEFVRDRGLEILHRSRRPESGDEWRLLDLGPLVVHLMSARARAFYELEWLWSAAPLVYREKGPAPEPGLQPS
jgi:ribosome-associated protein